MKIIFDTDGTLTDFNKFVQQYAIDFFRKKYGMEVIYPNKLEIEDIFDMNSFFQKKYSCTLEEAKKYTKSALDKFWISTKFVSFSLLSKFRRGARRFIREAQQEGHKIEIHTSRDKTCEKSIIGYIARSFTILQYAINGVFLKDSQFYFYLNDELKVKGIIQSKPDIVFDDKPEIINELSNNGLKCICVEGNHNNNLTESRNIKKIEEFDSLILKEKIESLIGVKKLKYYKRASKSDIIFGKIKIIRPLLISFFKPLVLHEENMIYSENEPIIYAPNHRSTLDPMIITALIGENIHWAALLRFFEGKDSIFNNSKNPILCKLTASIFKSLEYFPIDRKTDNPKANNFKSLLDMVNFLTIREKIGIFPEGTTRRPEGHEFGTFDDSFITLAKKTGAKIQPITTIWTKNQDLGYKVIINFGKAFDMSDMTEKEAYEFYLKTQQESLQENQKKLEKLEQEITLKKTLNNRRYKV